MNQIKNVVIGVDFSDGSRAALQQALRVAQWNKAHLHVVHVIEYLVITDLVVLGTKGRTNLKYMMLGSTVERLLRDVPRSVLTVKPRNEGVRVPLENPDPPQ